MCSVSSASFSGSVSYYSFHFLFFLILFRFVIRVRYAAHAVFTAPRSFVQSASIRFAFSARLPRSFFQRSVLLPRNRGNALRQRSSRLPFVERRVLSNDRDDDPRVQLRDRQSRSVCKHGIHPDAGERTREVCPEFVFRSSVFRPSVRILSEMCNPGADNAMSHTRIYTRRERGTNSSALHGRGSCSREGRKGRTRGGERRGEKSGEMWRSEGSFQFKLSFGLKVHIPADFFSLPPAHVLSRWNGSGARTFFRCAFFRDAATRTRSADCGSKQQRLHVNYINAEIGDHCTF